MMFEVKLSIGQYGTTNEWMAGTSEGCSYYKTDIELRATRYVGGLAPTKRELQSSKRMR